MCDELDNRGCEVVDDLTIEIHHLEMTIADLKSEIEQLKKKYKNCVESKISISKAPDYWVDELFSFNKEVGG